IGRIADRLVVFRQLICCALRHHAQLSRKRQTLCPLIEKLNLFLGNVGFCLRSGPEKPALPSAIQAGPNNEFQIWAIAVSVFFDAEMFFSHEATLLSVATFSKKNVYLSVFMRQLSLIAFQP